MGRVGDECDDHNVRDGRAMAGGGQAKEVADNKGRRLRPTKREDEDGGRGILGIEGEGRSNTSGVLRFSSRGNLVPPQRLHLDFIVKSIFLFYLVIQKS